MNQTLAHLNDLLVEVDVSDVANAKRILELHSTYLVGFSVIEDVSATLSDFANKKQDIISQDQIRELRGDLAVAVGTFNQIDSDMHSFKKAIVKDKLNDVKYWPQIVKKHENRLAQEHRKNKIQENKNTWITKKLNERDKQLVLDDVSKATEKLIESPLQDIIAQDVNFSTSVNVSSPLINILNQYFLEIEIQREEKERKKDQEFKRLFEKLRKEKKSNNPKTLYKNMIGYDRDGRPLLESEYTAELANYKLELSDIIKKYHEKLAPLKKKLSSVAILDDQEPAKLKVTNQIKKLKDQRKAEIDKLERKYFVFDKSRKVDVKDKYKNTKPLTATEKEVRDYFIDIIKESNEKTFGKDTLMVELGRLKSKPIYAYELPKITKSDLERVLGGDVKGIAKDRWKDLTQIRPDDLDYITIEKDQAGNVIRRLRIHYRNRQNSFDNKDQSLDLFTIMRLEYKNANLYNLRIMAEAETNFLLDIAKRKEYNPKQKVINWRNKKSDEIKGIESNTFKMMNNMLESRFYDIARKSNAKFGKADLNKIVSFVNSASAFLALSLNYASGTANVVNANAQLFLESFIKGQFISAKGIAKANSIYSKHLPNTLNDVTSPINSSYVNQLAEMFNIRGEFNLSNANFLKSDLIKKGLSRESLQVFQESGEHWIQSVTQMSVLEGIKVMDANGNFITKKGNVTKSEKNAASLLDMLQKDEAGIVRLNDKVKYTTHTKNVPWKDGGREQIASLIIKKLNDTIGNYRKIDQPDIMRGPGGQLLMLYRKYFVPMGQARFRGWEHMLRPEEDLEDGDRTFSYGLHEYEEGTYVSLIRYIYTSLRDKKNFLMFRSNWDKMTDYQRHNVKRAITEFMLIYIMLPLTQSLLFAMAGDDDDYVFFLAYQLRRLDTELSQYHSPREAFKMIRSPIPSARLIDLGVTIMTGIAPWNWDEKYVQGPHKGESKLKIKVQKQIPVIKEFRRTFEDLYDYQTSNVGTGL
jgi:hypothetical protein